MWFSSRLWNSGPALHQLYTLYRILEGAWEFVQPVHMCFLDLEKAFDRVPQGALWGVLRDYGVSDPLIRAAVPSMTDVRAWSTLPKISLTCFQ